MNGHWDVLILTGVGLACLWWVGRRLGSLFARKQGGKSCSCSSSGCCSTAPLVPVSGPKTLKTSPPEQPQG
ncbi:MAG: hypothetical protein HQL82_07450 [Magnetococcales bacterium]|nr:hypothetical protein [Magnetococcales bacterium]